MRTMQTSLILAALACAAAPARAQTRAVPAVTHAQYGVTVEPCFDKPMPEPDGTARFTTGDDDCGRPPVDPPIVQPVPLPCPDDGCGAATRRPDPDPCWYDDCPRGGGWDGRWRIQKEALRGGNFLSRQNALNALFDNMSGKSSAAESVYAGRMKTGDWGGRRLAASRSSERSETARLDAGSVPFPSGGASAVAEKSSWGAVGAGLLAMVGLLIGRRKSSNLVLASDEHTDPESRRNNPQHDPDVERGFRQNQQAHHERQLRESPSTKEAYELGRRDQEERDKVKESLDKAIEIVKGLGGDE